MEGPMSLVPAWRRRGGGTVWGEGGCASIYSSCSYHIAPPGRPVAPPPLREPRPIMRMLSTVLIRSPARGRLE